METFRAHLHANGVQHVLSPTEHEALRVTVVEDEPCLTTCGITFEGSNDGINWFTVGTILAGAVNQEINSPYLELRVRGFGSDDWGPNATVTVEYLAEAVGAAGATETVAVGLALRLDDVGSGVSYVGEADPGTAESSASWRIKRLTETGADLSVTWAGGTAAFDKVWDDRLALSYS